MKIKKRLTYILLLSTISSGTLYAANTEIKPTNSSKSQKLISEQSQVAITKINKILKSKFNYENVEVISDKSKDIEVRNIVLKKTKDTYLIKNISLKGLNPDTKVGSSFEININGLQIKENIKDKSTHQKTDKYKFHNVKVLDLVMTILENTKVNLDIKYNNINKSLSIHAVSNNQLFNIDFNFEKINLIGINTNDILKGILDKLPKSSVRNFDIHIDATNSLNNALEKFHAKTMTKDSNINFNLNYLNTAKQLNLNSKVKIDKDIDFDYLLSIKDFNISQANIKDISKGYKKYLSNAYIYKKDLDLSFNLPAKYLPKKYRVIPSLSNKISSEFTAKLHYQYGKPNFDFKASYLIPKQFDIKTVIDFYAKDKIKLMSILNNTLSTEKLDPYNCDNDVCVSNIKLSFSNKGLVQSLTDRFAQQKKISPEVYTKNLANKYKQIADATKNSKNKNILLAFSDFLLDPNTISLNLKAKNSHVSGSYLLQVIKTIKYINKYNKDKTSKYILYNAILSKFDTSITTDNKTYKL